MFEFLKLNLTPYYVLKEVCVPMKSLPGSITKTVYELFFLSLYEVKEQIEKQEEKRLNNFYFLFQYTDS